jgi:hypothetical protein
LVAEQLKMIAMSLGRALAALQRRNGAIYCEKL